MLQYNTLCLVWFTTSLSNVEFSYGFLVARIVSSLLLTDANYANIY